MLKQISILVLIFIFSVCAFAQTEQYNAPVKWEKYKSGVNDVSILFPKLPVLIELSTSCSEQETNQYAAYANETVYGLTVVSKTKKKIPRSCNNVEKFDEENFNARLKIIRTLFTVFDEAKFTHNDFEVAEISSKTTAEAYWLINDFKNKRWFELWVTGSDKNNKEVKDFIESIAISKNSQGIEIGKGSSSTLGDETIADANVNSSSEKSAETEKAEIRPIKIILKPKPPYTDAARESQITGAVRLRVTFLASGGIGSVSIVNALPFGLTEQAIASAKKLVFIPAKRNGKTISMVKIVEYAFSIY